MHIARRLAAAVIIFSAVLVPAATPAAAACTDSPAAGVDWSNCSFSFSNLADVDLRNADLRGIDFSYAILFRANLSGADLRGANMADSFPVAANLSGANLSDADLSDADLVGANLTGAILQRTKLSRSDVDLASIANASFVGADLRDADFRNVTGAPQATFAVNPVAVADNTVGFAGRSTVLGLLANDDTQNANPFAEKSIRLESAPLSGSFDAATGSYTPNAGFVGSDSFSYRLVHTLTWPNLPPGVPTVYVSEPVAVAVDVKPVVTVGPPYIGSSGTRGEVVRLYVALLRRQPDAGGFDYWVGRRNNGESLTRVASFFQNSSEFLAGNGGLDNTGYVTLLYHNVLERTPDSGGLSYWAGLLDSGSISRNRLTLSFTESVEFKASTGTS